MMGMSTSSSSASAAAGIKAKAITALPRRWQQQCDGGGKYAPVDLDDVCLGESEFGDPQGERAAAGGMQAADTPGRPRSKEAGRSAHTTAGGVAAAPAAAQPGLSKSLFYFWHFVFCTTGNAPPPLAVLAPPSSCRLLPRALSR